MISILFLSFNSAFSQILNGKVFGREPDDKITPLAGANIFWEGTKIGTISKPDGSFEIPRPKGVHMLIVSFVGYQQDTFHISESKDYVEIILTKELKTEEILVEGKQPDLNCIFHFYHKNRKYYTRRPKESSLLQFVGKFRGKSISRCKLYRCSNRRKASSNIGFTRNL